MKAFINWPVFTQTSLDSGSLTMLGAVIHNFLEPGEYLGTILRGTQTVGRFQLTVDKECPARQVNIDLATLTQPACERYKNEGEPRFVVNPKGCVVFHVSHGTGGYAVTVGKLDAEREARLFDSRDLKEGDLFAATLIRPGTYSVTNVNTGARGEIVVAYPKVAKVRYRPPEPVSIECLKKLLRPNKINIEAAQGQVYRFKSPSRIKIELVKPDDGPKRPLQPRIVRWSKPSTRQRVRLTVSRPATRRRLSVRGGAGTVSV